MVEVRRVYDDPGPRPGTRVLVDRLWPRGISREAARLETWCKEVAPSTDLRKWYGHDPQLFPEFRRRYRKELRDETHAEAVQHLRRLAASGDLVLLTATKEVEISAAVVLAEFLEH